MRDRLRHEPRDILLVGHFPHLPGLLGLLLGKPDTAPGDFPTHGMVALVTNDEGTTWTEEWRAGSGSDASGADR